MLSALSVFSEQPTPKVEGNGVSVYSPISYTEKSGKVMVDVNSFFNVMQENYQCNKKKSTITYKDEAIHVNTWITSFFNKI